MSRTFVLGVLFVAIIFIPVIATIINVPDDYPTIQTGIEAAICGDTVLVQPDIYNENIEFGGRNIIVGSLFLTTGDTSYISSTIIDGDSLTSTVKFTDEEDSTAVITGFTIQNGAYVGGGILCILSSPTITYNRITNNHSGGGGGVYCQYGANPIISNNIIDWNSSTGYGGGIGISGSSPKIFDNVISNNDAGQGGGIWCRDSSGVIISNNIITGNETSSIGGGILIEYTTSLELSNNTISDNIGTWGCGIYCTHSDSIFISGNTISGNSGNGNGAGINLLFTPAEISYNIITGNLTEGNYGGGIFCNSCAPDVNHCTICGNSAHISGGGICCGSSSPNITNCTISRNTTEEQAGGIYCTYYSDPVITNTIVWGDSCGNGLEIEANGGSAPVITYCDIEGGWEGESNIDDDPAFVDAENGDFHLLYGSPCIDAGDPDSPLDPDSTRADIGAFYFDQSTGIEYDDLFPVNCLIVHNYPNPFNAITTIQYDLPQASDVNIDIYNILGRKVKTLINKHQPAGYHRVIWNADDVSSGLYFYRIQVNDYIQSKRMLLLK